MEPFTIKTATKNDLNTKVFARIVRNFRSSYFSKYLQFAISWQLSLSLDTKIKPTEGFDLIYQGGKSTTESWIWTVNKKDITVFQYLTLKSSFWIILKSTHVWIDALTRITRGCAYSWKKSKTARNLVISIENWKNSIKLFLQKYYFRTGI